MSHRLMGLALVLVVSVTGTAEVVDVRQLGARGDGQHDDWQAFQEACSRPNAVVLVPPGTYRIGRPVVLDLASSGPLSIVGLGTPTVVMTGPGPAFWVKGTHAGTAAPNTVTPSVRRRERMPVIRGLVITGSHPDADGIRLEGTMQAVLADLLLTSLRHGIHLARRNRNVVIRSCHVYENRGVGIFLDRVNLHQINIAACHVSYNAAGGIVSRGGNVRNIQVSGCDIEGNMAADGPETANILLDSRGGSVGEVAITGCTIQHTGRARGSANIRIIGPGHDPGHARRTGSPTTHEGHVTITGNVLSDTRVNIHIVHARGVVITGNTIWKGFDHDILIEHSSHVVIGPNNLDRNPRYDRPDLPEPRGGITLRHSKRCRVSGLVIDGTSSRPAAIVVENSRDIHISDCSVFSDLPPVHVADSEGVIVRDVVPNGQPGNEGSPREE